jgi:hypothetical protein
MAFKPDNTMIKIPGNATPSQIANIKAYAKSLETRRKGAAADKRGAEGPKKRTPNKKAGLVDKSYSYTIGSSKGVSGVSPAIAKARAVAKASAEGPKRSVAKRTVSGKKKK